MGNPNDTATDDLVIAAGATENFVHAILTAIGADDDVATETAHHLVGANLAGHDSHGLLRIVQYVDLSDRGRLHANARGAPLKESPSLLLFDAQHGLGQWTSRQALEWCIGHAKQTGIAAAAVRHSNHVGRLGHYAEVAAGEGLVSITTVGSIGPGIGRTAPFHGVGQLLGTNPWCFGVPARDRHPLVADFATSQVAEGKLRVARYKGQQVAPGLIIDKHGSPTTTPADFYHGGSLLPLGGDLTGHKGYGLGLAAALIGSLAAIGDDTPTTAGTMSEVPPGTIWTAGFFTVVLDPAWFGGADPYRETVERLLDAAGKLPPAPGQDQVLVPGEPEELSRRRRMREGLPIPPTLWEQLTQLGERFHIPLPPLLPQ
ncbi:MAG: Ldh family oxidoreductase [Candidatus Dormibacteraeota bacterium]|nr:Ldh family oxidoreductase [Candidatus Dormibacteraeota bacterium]